jgi:hypothetical protein
MAKFEIDMEITGLKLKVRGERDDLPVIRENLSEQVSGLFAPAVNIAQGRLPAKESNGTAHSGLESPARSKRNRRSRRSTGSNGEANSPALDFIHDPEKWGLPRQAWKGWQKIAWLLHVVAQAAKADELSAGSIVETFNKHFRQAGLLKMGSMTATLGRMKQRTPALISDHANESPITWFLTEAGEHEAKKLVAEAKGEGQP